jgi:hypothetical protein
VKQKQRLFFILLFLAGLVVSLFYLMDFVHKQHPSFGGKLTGLLITYSALAIIVQLTAHVTRAYKSRLLINSVRPASTRVLFKGLSVGFLFNALLPLRLGELVRAFYIGDSLAISKTVVFMSIIIERIIDGLILGACFISASLVVANIGAGGASTLLSHIGLGLLVLSSILALVIQAIRSESRIILTSVRLISGIFNTGISNRLRFMAWSGIYGTKLMLADKKRVWRYFLLSIGMWVLYFASTGLVAVAFFRGIDGSKLWYVVQSVYAGVSAPAGPGYLGSFHLIVSQLLNKIGLESVAGFSSLMWLILVLPISLIGLVVITRQRLAKRQDTTLTQEMLVNKLHREKDISEEMANFLDAYFKGEEINQILTQAELDDKFKLIKSFRGGSNAHTMLVWQAQELRVKKIALVQYADKLEAQADWLTQRQNLPHLPKVIAREKTDQYYYFDLAYSENFVPFFEFIHSNSSAVSYGIISSVIEFMRKSIYAPVPVTDGARKVEDYIDNKVLGKADDTASINSKIGQLMSYGKLTINGKNYLNLLAAIEKIKNNKKIMKDLAGYQETVIHGDLNVDNLIVSPKSEFMILDPNNENQVSAAIVDYAKLYQSLHSGYEFLIQLEQCEVSKNKVSFEESKSQKYAEIFDLLDKKLRADLDRSEYRAILFHEAVHYCRMLTYRAHINPDTLPVFYCVAVKLFNEFIEQYA